MEKTKYFTDDFGAVIFTDSQMVKRMAARKLAAAAAAARLIPQADDTLSWDKKGRANGYTTHHEIYDYQSRPAAAIVCVRQTEGTRYGVATKSKRYFLVSRPAGKIAARELAIPVARYAKSPDCHAGDIVKIAGGKKIALRTAAQIEAEKEIAGFKLLKISVDGKLLSVWDGSVWQPGKTRAEFARDEHKSGLYYYRDLVSAIEAASKNEVFREEMQHKNLGIFAVKTTGKQINYGAKWAASKIVICEQVGSTI